jgi:hypothetical protein
LISRGNIVLAVKDRQVRDLVAEEPRPVVLCGHTGLGVNAIENVSVIGDVLARRCGTFGLIFQIRRDKVSCSLRSIAPFDVSAIAAAFGGGGHAQASGFRMSIEQFFRDVWT